MEPLWNAVVGRLLRGGPELRHLSKPVGPEKTALDRERVEGDPSLSRAASTWRHGQSTTGNVGKSTYTPITSGRARAWTEVLPVALPASRTRR